ncbi:MAG: ASKHA domain-containing protein, partial [Candidatus Bipolaricaulia bacterium]
MKDAAGARGYSITIFPQGDRLEAKEGENLFHLLVRHGHPIPSACGGMGTCGKCRVLIQEGLKPPTESEQVHLSQEELDQGWRLSCQQRIDRDIILEVPQIDETTQAKEMLEQELHITLDPGIGKVYLELPQPGQEDQRPDTTRIQEELGVEKLDFPLSILRKVPHVLREGDFKLTITKEGDRVLDLEPGNTTQACYGLAIDIGTTTLAGYLLDLNTGRELAVRSLMNPQKSFGADVISRIKHVHEHGEEGLKELQEAVISGINAMIRQLCQAAKVNSTQIYKVTAVGNPTMMHLFTAIDPSNIDHSPYIPVLRDGLSLPAKELELEINSEARVYLLPAISGYVGADITAGVLFTNLHQSSKLNLFVDIGTNAEIVLGSREKLLACSTPAGPAFEGARIKYGMSATPGAIAHVSLNGDGLKLEVIGNGTPKGICGSGLIDLIAELLRAGL